MRIHCVILPDDHPCMTIHVDIYPEIVSRIHFGLTLKVQTRLYCFPLLLQSLQFDEAQIAKGQAVLDKIEAALKKKGQL